MRKNNNKGFTILEVIIAMSILSVVTLVGYKVINGTEKTISHNKVIYEGQLNTNIVNKYLTNDIERSIAPPERDTYNTSGEENVLYTNFTEGTIQVDKVEYKVTTRQISKTHDKNWEYDLNRVIYEEDKDGNYVEKGDINLISKQPYYKISEDFKPFSIQAGDGIYTVTVNYQETKKNSNTVYEFEVSSRVNGNSGDSLDEETPYGNIVVHNKNKTIDTVINESISGSYNQKVKVVKHKISSKVEVIMPNGDKLDFEKDKLKMTIGGESKEFTKNDRIGTLNGKAISVSFDNSGKNVTASIGSDKIEIESTNAESDVELFKGTENEVDIEISINGKVDIEVGRDDDKKTYKSNSEDIDVDLKDNHGKGIKEIELKVLNTKVNKTNKETFNPAIEKSKIIENKYYKKSENEFDMELWTDRMNGGSYVVINFIIGDSITPEPPPVEEVAKIKLQHTNKNHPISRAPGNGNGNENKQSYIDMLKYENSSYTWFGNQPIQQGATEVNVKLKVEYIDNQTMLDIHVNNGTIYRVNLGDVTISKMKVNLKSENKTYDIQEGTWVTFTIDKLNVGGNEDKNSEILIFEGIKNK